MRMHPRCAMQINRSARELLCWHDPTRANERIVLPHWERVYLEYFKSIRHIPLSRVERLLCYGAVPVVSYWRRLLRKTGIRKEYRIPLKEAQQEYEASNQLMKYKCKQS